jgi:uncharacterized protein YecE (DUF72 family)
LAASDRKLHPVHVGCSGWNSGRWRGSFYPADAGLHAIELRHPSWFASDVHELLHEHGAALVIGDHPERPFQTFEATAPWCCVRLHYGSRGRRGNYSLRELEIWAERLHAWRAEGQVFVYFNNDWEACAPRNASTLLRLLDGPAGEREPG